MISGLKGLFGKRSGSSKSGSDKVVTRFAPSPTGMMHIGGVRTALYAYLWALKNGGTFILRIEDTDTERKVEGSIEHIQKALSWVGIEWKYGPDKPGPFGSCIQSERLDSYKKYAQKLIDKGLAYPDPYTTEEIEAFRKVAEAEKRPFLYRKHRPAYADGPAKDIPAWDGTRALRFKVANPRRMKWHDVVRGDLEAGEEAVDDFILIKKDGYPTYNFAHIIDDLEMGVTHIMRGEEFISSTPKFLTLYEALEIPVPTFVTLPPILRNDKTKKLGKRDGAKDMLDYKKDGFLPETMANMLAFIGWNPGTDKEIFSREELIEAFQLSQIQKSGGVFNEEKLRWMNKEHLKALPKDEIAKEIKNRLDASERVKDLGWNVTEEKVALITPIVLERMEVYSDVDAMIMDRDLDYYFTEPAYDALSLKWKEEKDLVNTVAHLTFAKQALAELSDSKWKEDVIKGVIWPYAEKQGRGQVLWPLRFALSGKDKSPNPFTLAGILGKEATIRRIDEALKKCADAPIV